jgi:Leucine-rich repeat (LRR) protein
MVAGFILLTLGMTTAGFAQVPLIEREALISLYNSTNGPGWDRSDGWLGAPGTECTWWGVICTPPVVGEEMGVHEFFLWDNNLSGPLPDEICDFPAMEVLDLSQNGITGPLPDSLGDCQHLEGIYLNDNAISGSIPESIGLLVGLRHLVLGGNSLTGSIPAAIGSMDALEALHLSPNGLSGPIPPELGDLVNLKELGLVGNSLDGVVPPEIGRLTNLEFLALRANSLVGPLPVELQDLTVQNCTLNFNMLWSDDPALSSHLDSMCPGWAETQTLAPQQVAARAVSHEVARVHLLPPALISPEHGTTGAFEVLMSSTSGGPYHVVESGIPLGPAVVEIGGLDLSLPHFFVVRQVTFPHMGNWRELRSEPSPEVLVHAANPGDPEREALLALFESLGGVQWFDTAGWFGPEGSECTWYGVDCTDSRITGINLYSSGARGVVPPEIGDLANLRDFLLGGEGVSCDLPDEIGQLTELQSLYVRGSRMTPDFPVEVCGLQNLQYLQLGGCGFRGGIPLCLFDVERLRRLELWSNHLSGEIPPGIGRLHHLEELNLSSNLFVGEVPAEIGGLEYLRDLQLDWNRLTGTIPPSMGNLTGLWRLDLSSNAIKGPIPDEILGIGPATVIADYNALWTQNPAVADLFVGFETTQTTPPDQVVVTSVGDHTVWLEWAPMSYQDFLGGYRLWSAKDPESEWTFRGVASGKAANRFPVTALQEGQPYHLAVESVTYPHHFNQGNTVVSTRSEPVTATTTSIGCPVPTITVTGDGPSVDLTVSGVFTSVEWSTGETTPTISVVPDPAVWYWVRVLGPGMCDESAVIEFASVFSDGFEEGTPGTWSSVADE